MILDGLVCTKLFVVPYIDALTQTWLNWEGPVGYVELANFFSVLDMPW